MILGEKTLAYPRAYRYNQDSGMSTARTGKPLTAWETVYNCSHAVFVFWFIPMIAHDNALGIAEPPAIFGINK